MQPGLLNPASLPPGAQVGPWCVVDRRGSGAYGAVYLAKGLVPEAALKVAQHPWNKRFGREAELLSRIRHPCVPRLIDHGEWLSPTGLPHAYVVMELIEGIPLYEWARAFRPSSRQVLHVLAGVASALAATNAVDAVHRDVKGDNVLVRLKDGHPFLIDFGSGYYRGAPSLTWQVFPPGTPPYRSPEAWRFALRIREEPVKVYSPGPAQDVFALGVTAYKLVTGQYPPQAEPLDPQFHVWRTDGPGPRPARELNPGCCEELNALIHRMLSRQPEARGSASELAEALEHAARVSGPEADVPLFSGEARRRVAVVAVPPPSHDESRRPSLALASVLGFLVLGTTWMLVREHVARLQDEARDAGTVAVGDSVLTAPVASAHASFEESPLAQQLPSEPFPGQIRTDARGRCPDPRLVPIRGGCWKKMSEDPKECAEAEYSYEYKGACYMPAFRIRDRPATSSPPEARDGGG